MKFRVLVLVIFILALGCDIGPNVVSTTHGKSVRIVKEPLKDAKIKHPGLGCGKDTIATKIIIYKKGISINEYLYPGESDTIWDKTIIDKLLIASQHTDTTIYVARGESDIVIYRKPFPAKSLYSNYYRIELLSGFGNEKIRLYANLDKIYEGDDFGILEIEKSRIDSLGIIVGETNVGYFDVDKKYNVIELSKYDGIIAIRFAYVF